MAHKKKQMRTKRGDSSASTDLLTSSKSLSEVSSSFGCTSIVSISDKDLLSIFSRLSLCDLECLELVSHHFRWIALKVYSDRRCLSLIQTPQYRTQLEDITRYWYFTDYSTRVSFGDDFYRVTREVNLRAVQWFGQRFPNVTQLTLYCVDHLSVDRFVQLIQLYPTLERLVLFSSAVQQTEYNQPPFWASLYSIGETLRHLHLPFNSEHQLTATQLSPLLTPTLRSLYLKTALNGVKLIEMFDRDYLFILLQCGELTQSPYCQTFWSSKLVHVTPQMDNDNNPVVEMRRGLYLTFEVLEGMEALTPAMSLEATNSMLRNYRPTEYLTHLDLAIPFNIGLLPFLSTLSQLTRLTHIRFTERKSAQSPSAFFSQLTKQNYRTKLGEPNRSQLPSVRQLNISQFIISPSTGILLYLSMIFPQIDTLCLEDCPLMTNSTGKIRANSFSIWLLSSVRRFAQLQQLHHNQRLVLQMDRNKDGDKAERDRCVQLIVQQVIDKNRI